MSLIDEIILRNKAQALVDQLRLIIPRVSDSDRFALFRSITEGYCPECGGDTNVTACGCQWG